MKENQSLKNDFLFSLKKKKSCKLELKIKKEKKQDEIR